MSSPQLPPPSDSPADADGFFTRTSYRQDADGSVVRITQRVQQSERVQLTDAEWSASPSVAPGSAFGRVTVDGNKGIAAFQQDEVKIERPGAEEKKDDLVESIVQAYTMAGKGGGLRRQKEEGEEEEDDGLYKAPVLADPTGDAAAFDNSQNDQLRAKNLPPEATEDDLRDLFAQYGNPRRVYLCKHPHTGESRGVAFITMGSHGEAEAALEGLHKRPWSFFVLHVSWAKPRPDAGRGGGVSRSHLSGYGQALPQNPTGN